MNLHQFASIALVLSAVILPTVLATLISGKQEAEPEFEYDYR